MPSEQSLYIDLPFTDAVLRLTPRWGELEAGAQAACLAGVVLVPLALVVWLYRYELKLVKPRAALLLLALRCCVLLFLCFIYCLQPVLATSASRAMPTRISVALDLSGSMTATDPQRPIVDKLRLARALRLKLPADSDATLIDGWIEHLAKRGATVDNMEWVAEAEAVTDPKAHQSLVEQRRALLQAVTREVDDLTRMEVGLRLLTEEGGRLLKKIAAKHQVELVGFADKPVELSPEKARGLLDVVEALNAGRKGAAWGLKPEQAARIFSLGVQELTALTTKIKTLALGNKNGQPIRESDLNGLLTRPDSTEKPVDEAARGADKPAVASEIETTDVAPPLERGLRPGGKSQGRLVGIVLLSDGRHNAPSSPAKTAERLGKRNVPIYPIVVGTATPRPSVTITEVQAPANASAENVNVTVRVRFKVTGLAKQDIVVSLEREEKRDGAPKIPALVVAHNGEDQYYDKSFVVGLDADGKPSQGFVVSIKPAVKPPTGNMTQRLAIKMDDSKPKVLVVDGEGRWEYHYLATALSRDPSLELQRVLFDPPLRRPGVTERELSKMGNPKRKLPAGADALADYQCIVLGDVAPEMLPLAERQRLEQFVSKHGGTLVIVAGRRFTPFAYTSLKPAKPAVQGKDPPGESDTDPFVKLLPIEDAKAITPEQGFAVSLTREGKAAPFMRMEADAAESERRWAALPLHYWGVVGKVKPAATALAYFRGPGKLAPTKAANDEDIKTSREQGLIVRQNYQRGQVPCVGLDSTWRWRYRVGDTYHHRFWGQVMRWAAADYIRFGTDKAVYQEGQSVNVTLSLEDKEIQGVVAEGELKTRVVREAPKGQEEKQVAIVPLTGADGMRVLKGQVRSLPVGQYRVELIPPDPSLKLKLGSKASSSFTITARDNKEMDRLETDEDLLRSLARESGNDRPPFTPATADEMVELLTKRAIRVTERYERGLWQEWGTLVFFLLMMTAEWVGRKWAGLP